jgi:hypothetical protein
LSLGRLRRLLEVNAVVGMAIAVGAVSTFVGHGDARPFVLANTLLAVFGLLVLVTVVTLPARVAGRYLVLPHRGVLAVGTLVLALEGLCPVRALGGLRPPEAAHEPPARIPVASTIRLDYTAGRSSPARKDGRPACSRTFS